MMGSTRMDRVLTLPGGAGLYLSGEEAAAESSTIKGLGIGRAVSLGSAVRPDVALHMHVDVLDMPTANLLIHLDACVDFILLPTSSEEECKEGGAVLVHCVHGHSRSAAVACAVLLRLTACSVPDAIAEINLKHAVHINYGFVAQLQVWRRMQAISDSSSENAAGAGAISRWFCYATEGSIIEEDLLRGDPALLRWVKCRKCRRKLVPSCTVLDHSDPLVSIMSLGEAARSSMESAESKLQGGTGNKCTSMYIEPHRWCFGGSTEGSHGSSVHGGAICCPSCATKLGDWDAAQGLMCSCGCLVKPAFRIAVKRIDA
jgi:hypothetical protein